MNQYIPQKKFLNYFILSLFLFLFVSQKSFAVTKTFLATGSWSQDALWSGGAKPAVGDVAIIAANCTVDVGTAIIAGLTVNSNITLTIANSAIADLSINGSVTVLPNGKIDNQGFFDLQGIANVFWLQAGATYIHNPRVAEEQVLINGIENFDPTSTLVILKWYDESIPLGDPTRVSPANPNPNFGHVIIDVPGVIWDQDGYFSNPSPTGNRIKGDLTIYNSKIIFDDGTGLSTQLRLQNVYLRGNAIAVFQTGIGRALTLVTSNFTDSSTLALDTSLLMYNSYGLLNWTVNGNLILAHNFTVAEDTLNALGPAMPNVTITVNGNATFGSANNPAINFVKQKISNLTMTVTGTTTIGTVSKFRMLDGYSGALNFTTGNLTITGGNDNVFMGSGDPSITQVTGTATVTVTNDFMITGTSSTYIMNADLNVSKTRVTVGQDFIMNSALAYLRVTNSSGAVTFKTTRDFTIGSTGLGGNFIGQQSATSLGIDTLSIGRNFLFNTGTAANYLKANQGTGPTVVSCTGNFYVQNSGIAIGQGVYAVFGDKSQTGTLTMNVGGQYRQDAGRFNGIYDGSGNMTFSSTTQPFLMNGGDFRGIYNPDTTNAGNTIFSLQSMSFNGGIWMMHYGINTISATAILTITNNCTIDFATAADQFMMIGLPYVAPANNTLLLSCTIGGSLSIGGANGTFVSSKSGGDETFTISQNLDISAGNNSFNITQNSGFAFGHAVTLNLTGNLNISGGTTFFSAEYGTATATISGNMNVTGGIFSIKGAGGFAVHNFNVNGNFVQSAGTFYLHNNSLTSTNASVNVTFNSDFTHSGGTIIFDNNTNAASASHVINIKGANYNLSGTGSITSANPGAAGVLGQINFSRVGTTNYNRSGTHDVQQARQFVLAGTTLVINSGNLQVASINSNIAPYLDIFSVQFGGILDVKTNQLFSNASSTYSIVELRSTARLRLQNVYGLFDNTNLAAISSVGNMNYNLSGGSIVEYYGISNQVLTGIGLGLATLPQHKYGILDINLPAGVQYVHVSNGLDSVFVRSTLNMRAGELSLDYDHITSNGGGKTVTIEMPLTTSITVIAGSYIRSETEDGSAKLKWKMSAVTGAHIVPFGMDAANNSLPVTYNPPAGTTGDVSFATYHTNAANVPWPPTVSQLNNVNTSVDNSLNTVDRFWNITVSGAAPPAPTIKFTCTAAEASLVSGTPLIAQKWMFPTLAWSYPIPGASQTPTATSVQVNTTAIQTGWWTLATQTNPLPVELLDFSAKCEGNNLSLNWKTASETNNNYFTVEKSVDGKHFELFKKIPGSGNSSVLKNYMVIDENPLKGINYYRLSQIDFNTHSEILKTISEKSCSTLDTELQLVIASDNEFGTSLLLTVPSNDKFAINVYDAMGKQVLSQENIVHDGFNEVQLFTKNLSSGIYIVKLVGNSYGISQRFFVSNSH